MTSKLYDRILAILTTRMIEINKIQLTSLSFTYLYIFLKSFFGVWFMLFVFVGDESIAIPSISDPITRLGRAQFGQQTIWEIFMPVLMTLINALIALLFLNNFKKSLNLVLDRVLLFFLLAIDGLKYALIIVLTSQTRLLIIKQEFFPSVINLINILFVYVWSLVFRNFYFSLSYGTKNVMAKLHSRFFSLIETTLMITAGVYSFFQFEKLTLADKIIFNCILLIARTLTINFCLLKWYFTNFSVQTFYGLMVLTQTIAILFNLILQLTQEPLLGSNYHLCVFITSIFVFMSWKTYFQWCQDNLYFFEGKEIKSVRKVAMYFKALYDLTCEDEKSANNGIIVSSIRKQHELKCNNKSCYCRNRQNGLDKSFIKEYILAQVQDIRLNFKSHAQILISELYFRFNLFRTYPDMLTKLQRIGQTNDLGIIDKFSLLKLKHQVIEWIADKNRSKAIIDIETPLKLEEITKQMQRIIKKDIEKKSKKWKYMSRGLCRTQELQQDTKDQISFLKQMTAIHHKWIEKLKRSTQFNFLLLLYYKKVSFLNVNVDQVQKNLRDHLKKVKEEQLSSPKEFSKCVFHKRSCIIESYIDEENMGLITRSSKNIYELFGYQQSKLIGINMNKLMPDFMGVEHDLILSDWVKTGTWRTIGKLKQIFCIHKEEFCFSALIYLKLIANERGLFFIAVIFKKNESDYLIVNEKLQIEGIGRKFLHCIGQNCRRLPIEFIVDNFPLTEIPKTLQYKTFVREFISIRGNEQIIDQFVQEKNHYLHHSKEDEKQLIARYKEKLQESQTLEKWEVKFDAKIYQVRQVYFYVFLLNYAKQSKGEIRNSSTTLEQGKYENVIIGHGRMNEDEDCSLASSGNSSNSTVGQREAEFYEEKNSSMASFAERQNFTLSKLLTIFYQFLINPREIRDRRIQTLNIGTLIQTLLLATIISAAFLFYINGLNEIYQYNQANSEINENLQRVALMYNKVISLQEYKGTIMMGQVLYYGAKDLNEYYESTSKHLSQINQKLSAYKSEQLYSYLKDPVYWFSHPDQEPFQLELIHFLEFYYYLAGSIAFDTIYNFQIDLLVDKKFEVERMRYNFPLVKKANVEISEEFSRLNKITIYEVLLIAWLMMAVFFCITLIFFIYSYKYHHFRFHQKYECLEIYKSIPPNLIDRVKEYYTSFYNDLFASNSGVRIETHFENLNKSDLIVEDCPYTVNANKIKFLGKNKFTGWIWNFFMFLAVNTVNIVVTYQVIMFIQPLDEFMVDINRIMDSQNKLLESYLDIKGAYFLSPKPNIGPGLVDELLTLMSQNEVAFNQMVTFESQTLNAYDPTFYDEFYKMLVNSVCEQVKEMLDSQQYADCTSISKTSVIQEGIITFMNNFQRKLRTAIEDLKKNLDLRYQTEGNMYFINRGFKDVDLTMSYNIKIFRKLVERILAGYRKGIDYVTWINIIVLVILVTPQVFGLVMWFHLTIREKEKLSFLYGSLLMIPPIVVKQVKNLPMVAKKILEFEEN